MRAGIVTRWQYPHPGGVSSHITDLKGGLEKRGHAVVICSPSSASPAGDITGHESILQRLSSDVILKCSEADVINAHDAAAAVAVRELADFRYAPLVLTLHGYLAAEAASAGVCLPGGRFHTYLMDMERHAYQTADLIITVDGRLASHVKQVAGREAVVLENAVDTSALRPLSLEEKRRLRQAWGWEGAHVAVCARRLTKKNGVEFAIRALSRIPPARRPYLLIAGDGELRPMLEALADSMGVSEYVRFLGSLAREDVVRLYQACDLALVPSVPSEGVEEATSIAALEAMAVGVPLVATSVGGLVSLASTGAAEIVPPGDADTLAEAIRRLVEDPSRRDALASAAREFVVREHGVEAWLDRYIEYYDKAIRQHKESGRSAPVVTGPYQAERPIPHRHPGKQRPLRLVFHATHNAHTGGAMVFFDYAEEMYRRGHAVYIVSPVGPPLWRKMEVPWVVADESEMDRLIQPADAVVAMLWPVIPRLLSTGIRVIHFEQGTPSLFEPGLFTDRARADMARVYQEPGVSHITVSRFAAAVMASRFGVAAAVVPNYVNPVFRPAATKAQADIPLVLVVGDDSVEFKGWQLIFDALRDLERRGMRFRVVQVSPSANHLYDYPRERRVDPSPEELAELYRTADLFVSASRFESFAMPPLEAMASGTPVVATDSGGIRSYAVHEHNCLLVPRTVEGLADGIARMLQDAELRARCVAGGLETASGFRKERSADLFEAAVRASVENFSRTVAAGDPERLFAELALVGYTGLVTISRFTTPAAVAARNVTPVVLQEQRPLRFLMMPSWHDPRDRWQEAIKAFFQACSHAAAPEFDPAGTCQLLIRVDPVMYPDQEGVLRRIVDWSHEAGIDLEKGPSVVILNDAVPRPDYAAVYRTAQVFIDTAPAHQVSPWAAEANACGLAVCRPDAASILQAVGNVVNGYRRSGHGRAIL